MKKTVITVIAVTAAAAAAYAEGVARDFNTFPENAPVIVHSNQTAPARSGKALAKYVQKAVSKLEREFHRQNIAYLTAQAQAAGQQTAAAAQPATQTAKQKVQNTTKQNQVPSYYYGREGKLLALSDRAKQIVGGEDASAQPADQQTTAEQKAPAKEAKKTEKKKGSIFGYLGFGPLPGESWGSYNERTRYAASQPFK